MNFSKRQLGIIYPIFAGDGEKDKLAIFAFKTIAGGCAADFLML